jgi:zinc protease
MPRLLRNTPTLSRRALLTQWACGATARAWPAAAALPALAQAGVAPAALRQAPFGLQRSRLTNGLQILALPMRGTQSVAVQMWFGVGGRDDPAGRSGFAHLFEHLMFKGTQHMAAETFDRLTEDVGGYNNAFTAEDVTAYQALVPGNHLERVLWAEGERLASLKLGPEEFDSERAVVVEEYRERVLASPYGKLFNALPGEAFTSHPYRRPVIGNMEDLAAATLDDVRQFHRTYYRPDNAVLVVAGAFEPAQLARWAQQHLGRVAAPAAPFERAQTTEPRRTQASRREILAPQVPLPAVALLWQGPPARHADAKALQVAAALLSGGESSRLHQALVYRDRQAQQAGFSADLYAQAGMLAGWGIQAGTGTLAKLEQGLRREIEALAARPIPPQELAKVRRQLLTQALVTRQTPEGLAEAVGWAHTLLGDGAQAEQELARLSAVSAQDVQTALRRHVLQAPAITLTYRQAPARAAEKATP